jgi:Flp pilus assembly protein TadD
MRRRSPRLILPLLLAVGLLSGACRHEERTAPAASTPPPAAPTAPAAAQPAAPAAVTPQPIPEVARLAHPGHKVMFVGLDGADWKMLDGLVADGDMPELARLVREGRGGVLESEHPPLSPLVWTTMMTGVSPLEHGILDFARFDPATGAKEPIESVDRQVPAVWNVATYAGRKVVVAGLWATYPAEPIDGVMVSDRLFGFLDQQAPPPEGVVFPPSRETWARQTVAAATQQVDLAEMQRFLPWLTAGELAQHMGSGDPYAHPISALRRILIETRVYDRLVRDAVADVDPDLSILYLEGTDSIGHTFAAYVPPPMPGVSAADRKLYGDVPRRYFAWLDGILGAYRRLAEQRGAVLVLASDHGFHWHEGRPAELSSFAATTAAKWHRQEGIYLFWGPGVEPVPGHTAPQHGLRTMATTLVQLLGLPPGKAMAGPPIVAISGAQQPFYYRAWYVPAHSQGVAPAGAGAEELAKLKSLGYIGASETTSVRPGGSSRSAGSYNNAGLILRNEKREDEAITAFRHALEIDPNLASALWNLSELLFKLPGQERESNGLMLRALANGLPEGERFVIGRAIAYQRAGKLDRSLALMQGATTAKPDDPELWLFLGRYQVEDRKCDEAVKDFQRALELDDSNPMAYASSGVARVCAGDRAGAIADFERSLQLDPQQPQLRDMLARVRAAS